MFSCILLYTVLRKEHAWSLQANIVTIQTKYQSKGNRKRTFMEENQQSQWLPKSQFTLLPSHKFIYNRNVVLNMKEEKKKEKETLWHTAFLLFAFPLACSYTENTSHCRQEAFLSRKTCYTMGWCVQLLAQCLFKPTGCNNNRYSPTRHSALYTHIYKHCIISDWSLSLETRITSAPVPPQGTQPPCCGTAG